MPHATPFITGRYSHYLVAVAPMATKGRGQLWQFQCDCGRLVVKAIRQVGANSSCGCQRYIRESSDRMRDDGRQSPEYNSWLAMKARCSNPKQRNYRWYGARGIIICERWQNSFEVFLQDMGPKPSVKHSIERINNEGNYEPGNCIWATHAEQMANRRPRMKVAGIISLD
jgi:hypothetical protein